MSSTRLLEYLSNPNSAALCALAIVGILGALFTLLPRLLRLPLQGYLLTAQLVAEVLVAFGLIGIVSFVGRSQHELSHAQKISALFEFRRDFQILVGVYGISDCHPMAEIRKEPDSGAIEELCKVWAQSSSLSDENFPWLDVSRTLFRKSISLGQSPLKANMETLSDLADKVHFAKTEIDDDLIVTTRSTATRSMSFILFCALAACIGVALKCARAVLQRFPDLAASATSIAA